VQRFRAASDTLAAADAAAKARDFFCLVTNLTATLDTAQPPARARLRASLLSRRATANLQIFSATGDAAAPEEARRKALIDCYEDCAAAVAVCVYFVRHSTAAAMGSISPNRLCEQAEDDCREALLTRGKALIAEGKTKQVPFRTRASAQSLWMSVVGSGS
jgi:hypothetical protein